MKEEYTSLKTYMDAQDMSIYEKVDNFQLWINQMDKFKINAFDITTTTPTGREVKVSDRYGKKLITARSFVSSNYLGLNTHPKVKQAAIEAIEKYGVGTSTTPVIGGYIDYHKELEEKIAKIHHKDDALLFSSGFAANVGVAQALLGKSDLAIVDKFIHASMYDGLVNTNVKTFGHNDLDYLEANLKKALGIYRNIIVIVDGVYSQDGDLPALPEICRIAKKYDALIILDDAHGLGVLGKNGYGTCKHFDVENEVDIITGTLSKAIGANGGYVTAKGQLIKYLRHCSRPSIFSASLAPAVVTAASKAIDLFSEEPHHREKLWKNTNYIRKELKAKGFNLGKSESPIIPILIGEDKKAKEVARELLENGVYIIPAIYPAVRLKDSRLRLNVSASHSTEDLDYFIKELVNVNKKKAFASN